MPLYEYECIKCRDELEKCIDMLNKKADQKTAESIVSRFKKIHSVEVVDLDNKEILAQAGARDEDAGDYDFYLKDGSLMVLVNMDRYRFSELIYEKEDEKKVKCFCGEKKKVERVVSSFSFTSDLSTDMPKPDLSELPPSVRNKMFISDYIEEKDRPKKNR